MLLFKPFLIDEILAGRKTETRRLWPHGPRVTVNSVQAVQPDLRSSFQKVPPACHVKILYLHRELLGDITPDSVRKEGFTHGDPVQFIAGFKEINAAKIKKNGLLPEGISMSAWNPILWVVGFGLWVQPKPVQYQKLF